MDIDEKLALFVNWTGILTFVLIVILHFISALSSKDSSKTSERQ